MNDPLAVNTFKFSDMAIHAGRRNFGYNILVVDITKSIDSEGIIHDDTIGSEKWSEEIQDKLKNIFNTIGRTGKDFTEVLLQPIIDHVPTRYAIHIWNNIPLVGERASL